MLVKSGRWEGLAAHRKLEKKGLKKIQSQGLFSTAVISKDITIYCLQDNKLIK